MNLIRVFIPLIFILLGPTARADVFGGDIAVLAQILTENIKQLIELEKILSNGRDNLALLRNINRGINDSLQMMKTLNPNAAPGLYGDLKNIAAIVDRFNSIYGAPVASPDAQSQRNVDRAVAEAVSMNNDIYDYAKMIDRVGEEIKSFSHTVSPGGAAKLTAQSLGVMLHVMNQQLRAQGALLKLQAQGLAASNKREKDQTAEYLRSATSVAQALKASNPSFARPRF